MTRFPPADVRRTLRREVGFGCPVPRCRSPFLEYHHFDPEWHVEHHHRPGGLIPLCPTHHAQAGAFTVEQLHQFKSMAHDRPSPGIFQWLRRELVGVVGSGVYHETPILVAFRNQPLIWFNRDELGHALLNVRMLSRSGQDRLFIADNDFVLRGEPTDFESPPSGQLVRVRYDNGDYLRVEFRQFETPEAACRQFEHINVADIDWLIQNWPATFVIIRMKVGETAIQFSPNWTRWSARGKGRVLIVSHNRVGLVLPSEIPILSKARKTDKPAMVRELNLKDAWAKLDRGKSFVAELRKEIEEAGAPNYREIPLRREFDPTSSCMIYYVAEKMQIPNHWGLLAGDALHNFRCALDYLAWQLAVRFYDGNIPDKEVDNIYFPIVYQEKEWMKNTRNMSADDASKIEISQPFKHQGDAEVPLDLLAKLSDIDKHKSTNVISNVLTHAHVANDGWPNRDSRPRLNENGQMMLEQRFSGREEVGEEVLRLHIIPTGPDPDVEVNIKLFRDIRFSEAVREWPVIPALYYIGVVVEKILVRFDGKTQRPPIVVEEFPNVNTTESES